MVHYDEYKTGDREQVLAIVEQYPFASISVNDSQTGFPQSVSAPVIRMGDALVLEFHIAKDNDAYDALRNADMALAVFRGPNAHISPSWYEEKIAAGQPTAPTWNYVEAKVAGALEEVGSREVQGHLRRLVEKFEATASKNGGWRFSQLDKGKFEEWSALVRGFRLVVDSAEVTRKLSQRESDVDRQNVIQGLMARGAGFDVRLARTMDRYNYA